jgi:hypothetical protein
LTPLVHFSCKFSTTRIALEALRGWNALLGGPPSRETHLSPALRTFMWIIADWHRVPLSEKKTKFLAGAMSLALIYIKTMKPNNRVPAGRSLSGQ